MTEKHSPELAAEKIATLKDNYEVRAVKILMDKKTEKFKPEIILRNKAVGCNENFDETTHFCSDAFVNAVLSLNGHMAVHLDRVDELDIKTIKLDDETFKARGFSLSGAENELRVCLKGHFISSRCGAVGVNLNNIYLNPVATEDDEKEPYKHLKDLNKKIEIIQACALRYCFENEYWEDPQLSLNAPGMEPDDKKKVTRAKIATSLKGAIDGVVDDLNGEIEGKAVNPKRKPQTPANKAGKP
jgi:hypothetical protein